MPLNSIQQLMTSIEEQPSIQEKLETALTFMREALAQEGAPQFKAFWEVRRLCLPLFKEDLPGPLRAEMWRQYTELTREGRRLKDHLDTQSSFAAEQIALAIDALEQELASFDLEAAPPLPLQDLPRALARNGGIYRSMQGKLTLLNAFASRLTELRKELMATEMRVRQKNEFFSRLSTLGDQVFPRRKALIRELSEIFASDIDAFISRNFSDEIRGRAIFECRDAVKAIQGIAKQLTLGPQVFANTRQRLSQCWDQLKEADKERKKVVSKHKEESAEALERLMAAIEAAQALDEAEAEKTLKALSTKISEEPLMRHDVAKVRQALEAAQAPINEKRAAKARALYAEKQAAVTACKEQIAHLHVQLDSAELSQLKEQLQTCQAALEELPKADKRILAQELKAVKERLIEREEDALCNEDGAQLGKVLAERKARRLEIKARIEHLRKLLGGSSLDLEESIRTSELMATEKERLEHLDQSIAELTQKIHDPDGL